MNCEFAEKVSIMIDGELPPEEIESVRAHISECPDCQELERDFQFFKRQIRESAEDSPQIALPRIPALDIDGIAPTRKRGLSIPIPVFVGMVCLILIGWTGMFYFGESRSVRLAEDSTIKKAPPETSAGERSLARFDNGGRTELFVIPRNGEETNK
ncbi:MAG: zf-HC2 domain-containing protein [Acidobacteria bacterium]|nr:zf-HC2 domain-containing protein [Acidobacteriota bacterium]